MKWFNKAIIFLEIKIIYKQNVSRGARVEMESLGLDKYLFAAKVELAISRLTETSMYKKLDDHGPWSLFWKQKQITK